MEHWLYGHLNGDSRALEGAVAIALDWMRYHVDQGQQSAFQWYDMATGIRASRLAFLLDKVFIGELDVDDATLAALVDLGELHAAKLLVPSFLSPGNHGLFQLAGLNTLCAVISWRSVCEGARSYVEKAFARLLTRWFTAEGVHRENSPYYHWMVLDAMRRFRVVERIRHPDVREIIQRGNEVTSWLTYPDGRWVPVGDSAGVGPPLTRPVEPWCLEGAAGCWAVRDLTESGYAIIRSLPAAGHGSSMLFVNAMGDATGHKHADDLGFVLIEEGREIFVDSGKYGYNRDEKRRYVISARAHNVPSIEGRHIGPHQIDPDETLLHPIRESDDGFVVEGVVERPELFRHERTFTYLPGHSLTIEDRLHNLTGARWQSNLHLAPDLWPTPTSTGFIMMVGDVLVRAVFEGEGCTVDLVIGRTDPYQGWVSVGYQQLALAPVATASCPPDLIESTWRITLHR